MKIKHIGKVVTYLILAVNTFFIGLLLLTAYSPHIKPVAHPVESCFGLTFPIFLVIDICFLLFWLIIQKYKFALLPLTALLFCHSQIHTYFPINSIRGTYRKEVSKCCRTTLWDSTEPSRKRERILF